MKSVQLFQIATAFLLAGVMMTDNIAIAQTPDDFDFLTVAERSEFQSTCTSAESIAFIDACAAKARHVTKFVFGYTVEQRELAAAVVSRTPWKPGEARDGKSVALVFANIHSGECCGKEALLMILRDLVNNPNHAWLENMNIVLVPNYNADANDRMGPNNRRGQAGPANGMGRRENAQELDLNRDFGKLDSPEARSLVGLMTLCNPELIIDCHTTNGSKHQYALTYAHPVNPACSQMIRDYMRNRMMPAVSDTMEKNDWYTFYYGNFNAERDRWETYGMEPRYSTDYAGLRGRLSVLSEAYAYISFEDRIKVTKDFVESLITYVSENESEVTELLRLAEEELVESARTAPERIGIPIDSKLAEFDRNFTIKGYKDDKPFDFECKFLGKYEPTNTVRLPYAYLIPAELARVADRLSLHGAKIEQLDADAKISVQQYTIKSIQREERSFQKHNMVRATAERTDETITVSAGTFVVRTAQPLGRLIAYMLEPESNDGFIVWNFFDGQIAEDQPFPVLRIPGPVELDLSEVSGIEPGGMITLDMIDGPDAILPKIETPRWHEQTNQYESSSWGRKLLVDAASDGFVGRAAPPVDAREVASILESAGLSGEDAGKAAGGKPNLSPDFTTGVYSHDGRNWLVRFKDKSTWELGSKDDPADQITFNAESTWMSWHDKQGLHAASLTAENFGGDSLQRVTAEDENHLVGKLDWVYQEELYGRGNFQGHWWAPTGSQLAYLELDETALIPFVVMDHVPVRGFSEVTNYPKAGDPLPTVRCGVMNAETGAQAWIDLSSYEGTEILISQVTWSDDGNHLYLQVQNREQTWLDLVRTNADGSSPEKLFRDRTTAWIESPGHPVFLSDNSFLWVSPRSGYKHVYQYTADGKLMKQLTNGDWEVRSLNGASEDGRYMYFHATKDNAVDIQGYRLEIESGELRQLTEGEGVHRMSFSHDKSFFIDSVSDVTTPTHFSVHQADGTKLRQIRATNNDRLNYLNIAQPEFLEVPTDNQPMDAMLIKPPDFDPSKKYPVLVFIYGGPQTPRVRNSFGGEWYLWHQMLAQKGYVIWMCDGRSSSYRSAKNVWPIYKNFAENELADIETGIEFLKKNSWVDGERIGLWGWSYGGYMTAYALCHSQTFKMGISGAPVTDWKNYDAIYTERYMDLPQNNPEGYEKTSLLPVAKDLSGKMLLIHGEIDDNVHINNSMQFVYELQKHNKQFDLMIYPKQRHSVRDDDQQAHLRKLMTDFVLNNL